MPDFTVPLLAFAAFVLGLHLLSALLTAYRVLKRPKTPPPRWTQDPVSLLRPVCGLDPNDEATLLSTFRLDPHPALDVYFCAARERDDAVPLVRRLMTAHPHIRASLLIGDDRPTANPKLNNLVKGWNLSTGNWVIMADSNVDLPNDYVAGLIAAFDAGTGLVCSPPIGSSPSGIAAEIECAFLNTYQARWQLAADTLGFGFAQGKTMLWRRELLDRAGGIEALGRDAAEDAAATKIVREAGLRVRVVDRPYAQPLGRRRFADIWNRQVRWARLRRATFPALFLPEILAGSLLPMLAVAVGAAEGGLHPLAAVLAFASLWYATEAALAAIAGWHFSWVSPLALVVRDLMLPVIWFEGLSGNGFTWRGHDMSATQTLPQTPGR